MTARQPAEKKNMLRSHKFLSIIHRQTVQQHTMVMYEYSGEH